MVNIKIVNIFYFKDRAECENFAYYLEKKGLNIFDISYDEKSEVDYSWSIFVSKTIKSDNELDLLCEKFDYIAYEFGGKFDGTPNL